MYYVLIYLVEIFTSQYSNTWMKAKKFGIEALKASGFGTKASEDKILSEVKDICNYLEAQKGAAVDLAKPLYWTACNVICSVLLNTRYTWDTPELNRVVKGCEDFLLATAEGFSLEMLSMYFPVSLMTFIFKSKIKHVANLMVGLRDFLQERIDEHRKTFDAKNIRDFLDMYIRDRNDEKFNDNAFVSTCSVFCPDAVITLGDTILWALLYLGLHPELQREAQKQINQVTD